MSYKDQKLAWLAKHPRATTDDAYEAGYMQCLTNFCKKETFTKKRTSWESSGQRTANTTISLTGGIGASINTKSVKTDALVADT